MPWFVAIAAATDFILSILPIVFLWNIKIIWRVKIGVCAIMALGFAYVNQNDSRPNVLYSEMANIHTGVEGLPLRVLFWFLV